MKEKWKMIHWLCLLQGIYFFLTGIWPVVHMPSFIWISGHKYDLWLVETVGLSLAVIGLVLISAAGHKRINAETFLLATASAAALAYIDIYYASLGRILPVYLLDAAAEGIFIISWFVFYARKLTRPE